MYVCMYACMFICGHNYVICRFICSCMYVCLHLYVCLLAFICVYVCMTVCMFVCFQSQFRFDSESDVFLTPEDKKVLFDGHLSGTILFSYNAKAVDGQLCLEASPNENQSFFAHSPHATLLEVRARAICSAPQILLPPFVAQGVNPVKTTTFHNIFHSLGGFQVRLLSLPLSGPNISPALLSPGMGGCLSCRVMHFITQLQALVPLFSQLDTAQASGDIDSTLR